MKVVIFGKGKVGVATDLTLKTKADFHDPPKGLIISDFSKYDLAIICVSSLNSGPTDHDALEECLKTLNDQDFKGLIAIRCTVSPLFMRLVKMQYRNLKVIHFPEFMRQQDDVYLDKPWVLVLGGDESNTKPFGEWLLSRGYGTKEMLLPCSVEESSLIKLHQNAGLALKVVYANIMYETCKYYEANYETVRRGVAADARVGPGHLQVPGEDGFGFAGHCLPKDLDCLNQVAYNRGFWEKVIAINSELRKKNV
jgi:UDP-glucose 6-dehydrogenase